MSPVRQPQPGAGSEVSEHAGRRGWSGSLLSHWVLPPRKVVKPYWAEMGLPKALLHVFAPRLLLREVLTPFPGGTLSQPLDWTGHVQRRWEKPSGSQWVQWLGGWGKLFFALGNMSVHSAPSVSDKVTLSSGILFSYRPASWQEA